MAILVNLYKYSSLKSCILPFAGQHQEKTWPRQALVSKGDYICWHQLLGLYQHYVLEKDGTTVLSKSTRLWSHNMRILSSVLLMQLQKYKQKHLLVFVFVFFRGGGVVVFHCQYTTMSFEGSCHQMIFLLWILPESSIMHTNSPQHDVITADLPLPMRYTWPRE